MITNTRQPGLPASRQPNGMTPKQVASASASLPIPVKPHKAVPSQTEIAEKAYAIWLSLGQVGGCDQQHWFEAERQLQRA